jgi:hypothetical protein
MVDIPSQGNVRLTDDSHSRLSQWSGEEDVARSKYHSSLHKLGADVDLVTLVVVDFLMRAEKAMSPGVCLSGA